MPTPTDHDIHGESDWGPDPAWIKLAALVAIPPVLWAWGKGLYVLAGWMS